MAEISTGSGAPDDLPTPGGTPVPPYGSYGAPSAYVPPATGGDQISSGPAEPVTAAPSRRSTAAKGAGLLVAGLLVGVLGVTALQGNGSTPTNNAANTTAAGPGGQLAPGTGTQGFGGQGFGGQGFGGQGFGGRGGGVAGETRTVGTVTAVSGSTVTVRGTDGTTATYQVNSDTEIARDGAQIALSDVKAGETVLVHVLPGDVAERVLVGTLRRGAGPGTPSDATTTGDTI